MKSIKFSSAILLSAMAALATAQSARGEAELLGFQRFVGNYDVTGTWKGQPVSGSFHLTKNSDGTSYSLNFEGKFNAQGSVKEGLIAQLSGGGLPALPEGKASLEGRAYTLTFGPTEKPKGVFAMRIQSRSEALLTFTDYTGATSSETLRLTARKR